MQCGQYHYSGCFSFTQYDLNMYSYINQVTKIVDRKGMIMKEILKALRIVDLHPQS